MTECPQCGAKTTSTENCEDRFQLSQAMELVEPARYIVHHLSVPCYYLQHHRYSRTGWLAARELLRLFVMENWTPEKAIKAFRSACSAPGKRPGLVRGNQWTGMESVSWSYRIVDVRMDSAEHYCKDVQLWAVHVLEDSRAMLLTSSAG